MSARLPVAPGQARGEGWGEAAGGCGPRGPCEAQRPCEHTVQPQRPLCDWPRGSCAAVCLTGVNTHFLSRTTHWEVKKGRFREVNHWEGAQLALGWLNVFLGCGYTGGSSCSYGKYHSPGQ